MSQLSAPTEPFGVPLLEDLPDPAGATVLVRATLDLPISADPSSPLARLRAEGLAATVRWLVERGASVTVWGHGDDDHPRRSPAAVRALLREVEPSLATGPRLHVRTCVEDAATVARVVAGHDLYVNDSLHDSLLPVPSVMVPPRSLPSAAGRSLQHDLALVEPFATRPDRPFVAVLGGERTGGRLANLEALVLRADAVLLGGGLALPMLRAVGREPTDPDDEMTWECRRVLGLAQRVRHRLVVPDDLVWASDGPGRISARRTGAGDRVVDIGPASRLRFGEELAGAGSVLWAGSVGRVEDEPFRAGTRAIAGALGETRTVLLGGDALVDLLVREEVAPPGAGLLTATDSAIELLKSGDLPALTALRQAPHRASDSAVGHVRLQSVAKRSPSCATRASTAVGANRSASGSPAVSHAATSSIVTGVDTPGAGTARNE